MLAIARACARAKIPADEPTGDLTRMGSQIREIIRCCRGGRCTLLSSKPAPTLEVASSVLIMEKGKIRHPRPPPSCATHHDVIGSTGSITLASRSTRSSSNRDESERHDSELVASA